MRPHAIGAALAALTLALSVGPRSGLAPVSAGPHEPPRFAAMPGDRPLGGHDAVYDASADRLLLHGGEIDFLGKPPEAMRQLDLSAPDGGWSDVPASGQPPIPRLTGRGLAGSRAVVDGEERLMTVVCDCRNGTTHLFDLTTGEWSRAPGDRLLPMWYPLLVYDPVNDRAVMYGGDEMGDNDLSSDGWAYDLSADRRGWSALPPAPFTAIFQAAGYDDASGHLVVFGGWDEQGGSITQLWRLDVARADEADAWSEITPPDGPAPDGRVGATLAFVPGRRVALLYGGHTVAGDLPDAWLLDYADPDAPSWHLMSPNAAPGPRAGHSATWDAANARLVVYGGKRGLAFLDDAWQVTFPSVGTITPIETLSPSVTPTGGSSATSTADPSTTPTATSPPGGPRLYLPITHRP